MEETREVIRNIKKELRLFMNGVTSAQQRKLGMQYNIIFGVSIPHLKEIAKKFPHDTEVAKALWKENIRESKLLAIFMLPKECHAEVAEQWIGECRYKENADHLAHCILSRLPDATEKALDWACNGKELYCYCGFLTLAHLFRGGKVLNNGQEQQFFTAVAKHIEEGTQQESGAAKALSFYTSEDEEIEARFSAFNSMKNA